ncbi:MAG: type IV pilus twitching motility protein PilT [Epulopiscium sp.]|nr:type IV pilus twitching motility protein PilT [Candidatus Epulonipiscium sp.]
MQINDLVRRVVEEGASDLHITVGVPPMLRVHGQLIPMDAPILTPADTKRLVMEVIRQDHLRKQLQEYGQVDLAYGVKDYGRYRVNAYMQRGAYAMAMRYVVTEIPTMESLGLPVETLESLADNTRGLVLVTGPTGSGKSTTLATMIDYINRTRKCHILTLEDPIEYLHNHRTSVVNQREIGTDSRDYAAALRAALREDPDVILVGEMRDPETIATAITAAETGHLVLSTLHTLGASQTIDRIIDVFPPFQQEQIRIQLASMLKGVMSQQLLVNKDGDGRCLASEIMLNTPAVSNLIRESKTYQIGSHIQTGKKQGMQDMDASLISLYKRGLITMEQVRSHAFVPEEIHRLINAV